MNEEFNKGEVMWSLHDHGNTLKNFTFKRGNGSTLLNTYLYFRIVTVQF